MNVLPSEEAAVVATIDPASRTAGTYDSDWVDMGLFGSAQGLLLVGAMTAGSTVDGKIQQATDSAGTGAKDITGKNITQLTQAGADDNKQAVINFGGDDLDRDNGFRFARLRVTVATAASLVAGIILGHEPRYAPASDNDLASVDEIIS